MSRITDDDAVRDVLRDMPEIPRGLVTAAPKPTPTLRERKPLRSRPHVIPAQVRADTLAWWGSSCLWCHEPGGAVDLHHVLRRSQGGKDWPLNLRPVHRKCHSYIHEHPAEAKRRGFLA